MKTKRSQDRDGAGLGAARLCVLTMVSVMLTGCMWVASSVVCGQSRAASMPMVSLSMIGDESTDSALRRRPVLNLRVWPDGTISYWNGDYEWCQQLETVEVAGIRAALASLAASGVESEELAGSSLKTAGTVVEVSFNPTEDPRRPFSETRVHRPKIPAATDNWPALDELLCLVETRMGSGYRHQITKHFSDVLQARGSHRPCGKAGSS